MIIRSAELETVAGVTSILPENSLAEIAFAGKSNVGKSSLINGLLSRKSLARTSASPGKTQTINFYRVSASDKTAAQIQQSGPGNQYDLYLVDLPGYGYAKASARSKEEWGKLIEKYLHTSPMLRSVCLLVDIRHAPGANDRQMYDWIVKNGREAVVIATKLDKIKKNQVPRQLKLIREGLGLQPGTRIIPFSAETKQGREEIWAYMAGLPDVGRI